MRDAKALFDLSGRVAIVTGGRGLYGSAISAGLCEMGATVVVASRNLARCEELAASLRAAGHTFYQARQTDGDHGQVSASGLYVESGG